MEEENPLVKRLVAYLTPDEQMLFGGSVQLTTTTRMFEPAMIHVGGRFKNDTPF